MLAQTRPSRQDLSRASISDEFLSNVVDVGLGIIGVQRLYKRFRVQISLLASIVFSAEHMLLPLLQYSVGVLAPLENIFDSFESLLSSNWDYGCHGPVGGKGF